MKKNYIIKHLSLCLFCIIMFSCTPQNKHADIKSDNSSLKWTGKKITGSHWGYIKIQKGTINYSENIPTTALFVFDMNSITCKDLDSEEYNKKLINHLKSNDFFNVNQYPTSTLEVTKFERIDSDQMMVEGALQIKNQTHPIEFVSQFKQHSDSIHFIGHVEVDRTQYDIKYGSGKFFDNLGDKTISDKFIIEFNIKSKIE